MLWKSIKFPHEKGAHQTKWLYVISFSDLHWHQSEGETVYLYFILTNTLSVFLLITWKSMKKSKIRYHHKTVLQCYNNNRIGTTYRKIPTTRERFIFLHTLFHYQNPSIVLIYCRANCTAYNLKPSHYTEERGGNSMTVMTIDQCRPSAVDMHSDLNNAL